MRDVRETNICRISVHRDDRTGRAIVFAAIDNLWKGAASQAVQNLNLMLGLPEEEGIGALPRARRSGDSIVFGSRWVQTPGNVSEPGGGLPQGFRAAGVACGIKPSGQPDLGLLVSSAPATTSAARFTPRARNRRRCSCAGSA